MGLLCFHYFGYGKRWYVVVVAVAVAAAGAVEAVVAVFGNRI